MLCRTAHCQPGQGTIPSNQRFGWIGWQIIFTQGKDIITTSLETADPTAASVHPLIRKLPVGLGYCQHIATGFLGERIPSPSKSGCQWASGSGDRGAVYLTALLFPLICQYLPLTFCISLSSVSLFLSSSPPLSTYFSRLQQLTPITFRCCQLAISSVLFIPWTWERK